MQDTDMEPYIPLRTEDPLLYFREERKTVKTYANCERATKGLIRCINMQRYAMKIGPECVSFCMLHIVEAISNVIRSILTQEWRIEYWDNISNRWETQELAMSNSSAGLFAIRFTDENERIIYTIYALTQQNEDGSASVDFGEPVSGAAPRGDSDIDSMSLENVVAHFLQRYTLQPMTMTFEAYAKNWTETDIERRFVFPEGIDMQTANHFWCGTTKIPAHIELDISEQDDAEGEFYFIKVEVPIDFSTIPSY
jgi:hypothetical protein